MHKWDTVAIVGVGLIGGSIGLALRRRGLAKEVVGIGRRPATLRAAKKLGAVDRTTQDVARGVAKAAITVVCTPVERVAEHVLQAAAACPEGAMITDAGSAKAAIVAQLNGNMPRGVRFIGSHPLAGSEKSGPAAATDDLFVGRKVVITPGKNTSGEDAAAIAEFWQALGASVLTMTPNEHDRLLAASSHLPHLMASALAAATPEDALAIVSTGWTDTTRIAAGDAELWTQIFTVNREPVLAALDRFESSLAAFRNALEKRDGRKLHALLTQAKRNRDAVGS